MSANQEDLDRLNALARDLEPAELAEVIDLAARLRERGEPELAVADEDRAWLETDGSGLAELEPYDWGPGGPPVGTPVRWDASQGAFVLREAL